MDRSDTELVIAYKNGDMPAFNELVERHISRIYAFALRLSGDPHVAEDVTAETCIKVWKHIDSFDETKRVMPWIFTIARNTAFDFFRKRKDIAFSHMAQGSEHEGDFEETISDGADSAEIVFDQKLSKEYLEQSLRQISLEKRTIVLLHDIEGLTFDEIAQMLDKSLNTVKSVYRRTLLGLQKGMHQNRKQ